MKLRINIPIIVEGRYDKAKLSNVIDGTILTTEGFGIFRNEEKRALIRKLGQNGIVILCDSDGGGKVIRSRLRGMLGGIKIYDLYTPQIEGKEKRKARRSAAGYLGVEGIGDEVLTDIFAKFAEVHPELFGGSAGKISTITTAELYELGLSGGENSAVLRDECCRKLGLPCGMNAKSFREALGILNVGVGEIREILSLAEPS